MVSPWGEVLADCGETSPCYKIVDIDMESLDKVRNSMHILNGVRDDLYLSLPYLKSMSPILDQLFPTLIRF